MTKEETKQLNLDVKKAINQAMAEVHQKWNKHIPTEELRLIACQILSARAYEAAIESVQKSMKPSRKIDKLITLLKVGHTPAQAAELVNQ